MILWLLRRFRTFTDLEALAAMQAETTESLTEEVRAHESTKRDLEMRTLQAESERSRRLSAETVAAERREEIDRLLAQNQSLRDDFVTLSNERLKSLDNINVKLLEPRAAEPTPDLAAFQNKVREKIGMQVVSKMRTQERALDLALLRKLHPNFMPTNAPLPETEPAP